MKPRICVTLFAQGLTQLEEALRQAEEADLIELRFDLSKGLTPKEVRKLTAKPLIATNRLKREGGSFQGREEERLKLLYEAAEAGFEYVDLEASTKGLLEHAERLKAAGAKLVVSSHNFKRTPSLQILRQTLKNGLKVKPEICKIVSMARRLEDNLTMLSFLSGASKRSKVKIVAFCMGSMGVPSRVLSPLFGGYFTYASISHGREAAPGQLSLAQLREIYRLMGFEG